MDPTIEKNLERKKEELSLTFTELSNALGQAAGQAFGFGLLVNAIDISQPHDVQRAQYNKVAKATAAQNFTAFVDQFDPNWGTKLAKKNKASASKHDDDQPAEVVETKKRKAKALTVKKAKDPNAPKRPASAYLLYQNDVRKDFQAQNPNLTYAEVVQLISKQWASMDATDKEPYNEATRLSKVKYDTDKTAYETGLKTDAAVASSPAADTPAAIAAAARGPPKSSAKSKPVIADETEDDEDDEEEVETDSKPHGVPPATSEASSAEESDEDSDSEPPKSKKQKRTATAAALTPKSAEKSKKAKDSATAMEIDTPAKTPKQKRKGRD